MSSLSRLETEFAKLKRRRKRRRPWITSMAVLVFATGTAAAVNWDQLGLPKLAAISSEPTTEAASNPAPALALPGAGSNRKLTLWSPQKVDADTVPIMFSYEAAKAQSVKAELLVKKQGEPDYRAATLNAANEFTAQSGRHMYSLQWDKAKDGIEAGTKFDVRLMVTAPAAEPLLDEVRNVVLDSREKVRNSVNRYVVKYSKWSDADYEEARQHAQLAILDVSKGAAAEQIQSLRAGRDPHDASDDILVLGYISVGEDQRTIGLRDKTDSAS